MLAGRVAQLVRAPRLHRGCRGFESLLAHFLFSAHLRKRPRAATQFLIATYWELAIKISIGKYCLTEPRAANRLSKFPVYLAAIS